MLIIVWAVQSGARPRWKAAERAIASLSSDDFDPDSPIAYENDESLHRQLTFDLGTVRAAQRGDDPQVAELRLAGRRMLATGGIYAEGSMEAPTELYDSLERLIVAGVLDTAGFDRWTNASLPYRKEPEK